MVVPSPVSNFLLKTLTLKYSAYSHLVVDRNLPIPVQRLPRPSGSVHFGDVSEMNGWDHVIRKSSAARNNEAEGLGKIATFRLRSAGL